MYEIEGLEVALERGVAHLTLNTATGDNRMTPGMVAMMTDLFRSPPSDIRLVRISARGEAFCLGPQPASGALTVRDLGASLLTFNRALVGSHLVTIAEVQGTAAGFGVGVACLPDLTIAAESATFVFPEVQRNLSPALVLSWLGDFVGPKLATWLVLTGRSLGAREAATAGLVSRTVPDIDLKDEVDVVVEDILGMSVETLAEIKRFIRDRRELPRRGAEELALERMGRWAER